MEETLKAAVIESVFLDSTFFMSEKACKLITQTDVAVLVLQKRCDVSSAQRLTCLYGNSCGSYFQRRSCVFQNYYGSNQKYFYGSAGRIKNVKKLLISGFKA